MTGSFRADPEALAARAAVFDDLAGRASAITGELQAALDAAGPCWGEDAVGRSFAAGHVAAADALARLDALPAELRDVGQRFAATAATYLDVERGAEDTVRGVSPGEPSP